MQRVENKSKEWEMLYMAYRTIFDLNKANISQSAHTLFDIFDNNLSYSFNLTISQMIYSSFISQSNDPNVYIIFINEIEALQKTKKSKHRICEIFTQLLLKKASQESNYLLENMIEQNLIDKNITKNISSKYFAHYKTKKVNKQRTYIDPFEKQFIKNYEELSKNDWALHKQLIKEGHNPNEIAKIIRKDEVEKLQEISSQTNFDFNQKIEPSLYERCSFVNHENVTLIDYAAYFGSVKCFKYLFMNDPDVEDTYEYAIAGGNLEIIHLCEQSHLSFWKPYETAIKFHQNDIFKYLYEKEAFNSFGEKCVSYNNYEILSFLEKKGMKINDNIIYKTASKGNIFLIKYFLEENLLFSKYIDILFFSIKSGNVELVKYILNQEGININFMYNGRTGLMLASEKGQIEIVKLLLKQEGIGINFRDCIYGNTALILASKKGNLEIVKLLLEQKGIDVNAKDKYGIFFNLFYTALMYASENGHTEIVNLLQDQEGNDIDDNDYDQVFTLNQQASKIMELLRQG